jgi:hypothetical protein
VTLYYIYVMNVLAPNGNIISYPVNDFLRACLQLEQRPKELSPEEAYGVQPTVEPDEDKSLPEWQAT